MCSRGQLTYLIYYEDTDMSRMATIPIDQLQWNPVQPPARTTNDALKTLEDTIRRTQTVVPLVVVSSGEDTYIICDGHRRFTVAQRLGLTHLPCQVVEGDAAQTFVDLNLPTRAISGRDWWAIYAANPSSIACFTPKTRANLLTLQSWLGLREMIRIGREGKQSPAIANLVLRVLSTVNLFPSTAGSLEGGQVFGWINAHGMQRALIELLKHDITQAKAARLMRAVQNNRSLTTKAVSREMEDAE